MPLKTKDAPKSLYCGKHCVIKTKGLPIHVEILHASQAPDAVASMKSFQLGVRISAQLGLQWHREPEGAWKDVSDADSTSLNSDIRLNHERGPGTKKPQAGTVHSSRLKMMCRSSMHLPGCFLDGKFKKLYLDIQRALHFIKQLEKPVIVWRQYKNTSVLLRSKETELISGVSVPQ